MQVDAPRGCGTATATAGGTAGAGAGQAGGCVTVGIGCWVQVARAWLGSWGSNSSIMMFLEIS